MSQRRPSSTHRTPQGRAAFTLIEVMVSLGVMMVGAMAIIALQQQAIRANSHARELTTAMQIAQIWVERFKQDATRWNQAAVLGGAPTAANVLANTKYLQAINAAPDVFQAIPANAAAPGVSNAFDFRGNDVPNTGANVYYCASFRPAWVSYGRAMRVDVRVWWARSGIVHSNGFTPLITGNFPACSDTGSTALDPPPGGTLFDDYHVVYLPSVIRMVTVDI